MIYYHVDKPDISIPVIKKCTDFLKKNSDCVPGTTIDLDDGIRCTISKYQTVAEDTALWEAHKRNIDLHFIIQGNEQIAVCSIADSQIGCYHAEKDYLEANGIPTVKLRMTPGSLVCLFPNDVHQTRVQVCPGKNETIVKAIFKIPVSLVE